MCQSYILTSKPTIIPEKTSSDTVDLGITYKKGSVQFPLFAKFLINNDTESQLRITNQDLTSAIFAIDGSGDQTFRQFTDDINTFPIVTDPANRNNSVTVQYLFPNVINEIKNVNKCIYICGLLDEKNNMVVQDTFTIIARKTDKYVGAYEEEIDFDSVYVESQFEITKNWFVKNVWKTQQRLFKDEYKLLSSLVSGQEIIPQRLTNDIVLAPNRDAIDWEFKYKPLDMEADEAIFKLYFYPFESEGNTTEIDSIETKVMGTGVLQRIDIVEVISGHYMTSFGNKYTIDLGNLRPGDKEKVTFVVQNKGNFAIGNKAERFENSRNDILILLDSLASNRHLRQNQIDTISVEFIAGSGGKIESKYLFESDLLDRNIRGAQKVNSLFEVNFTGTIRQPILLINKDSVDFGSVTISADENCNSFVSQTLQIKNIGNETLNIYNIIPNDLVNFSVQYLKSELAPTDTSLVTISYEPSQPGKHLSDLSIITNSVLPFDTTNVKLVGRGVPQADIMLKIDSSKSLPGTEILMPIVVEKEKIVNANKYTDVLRFNRTLLQFIEPIHLNTASSAASIDTKFDLNQDGNLVVNLKRQSEENFLKSDTLVILKFATFLGNAKYSNIDFTDSKFSNKNCDKLFEIKPHRGIYQIDSVCGLDFKIYDAGAVTIFSVSPNPTQAQSNINIFSPVDMNLDIQIINTLGRVEMSMENANIKSGNNSFEFDFSNLSNGLYNVLLVKDRIIANKTIVISK